MKSPAQIAKKAAKKAIQRIGAIQIGTKKMDVIFDKSVSGRILNIFSQMILGSK